MLVTFLKEKYYHYSTLYFLKNSSRLKKDFNITFLAALTTLQVN
nr:MAG TPA: hypothetical protein [Caudoviricetes sp.]